MSKKTIFYPTELKGVRYLTVNVEDRDEPVKLAISVYVPDGKRADAFVFGKLRQGGYETTYAATRPNWYSNDVDISLPWHKVGETEKRRIKKQVRLTPEERGIVDRVVMSIVNRRTEDGFPPTPTEVWIEFPRYLFDDRDAESEAAQMLSFSHSIGGSYKKKAIGYITSSLKRLKKQGKVDTLYVSGLRGREVTGYYDPSLSGWGH
tara:strand:- start:531 stop:1148 length:618 start_codon:yes stop_codon:yes gene_type:complete